MWIISKSHREFFFFNIFAIHSSSRYEKCCQMSLRPFSLFQGSRNQLCQTTDWLPHGSLGNAWNCLATVIYTEVPTGSTIRNWHKVKKDLAWPDVLTISKNWCSVGSWVVGNLCLIHYLKLFWPHGASTASVIKDAVKHWIFDDTFHKKFPVLVPVMIRPSGPGSCFGEIEASEVAEAA